MGARNSGETKAAESPLIAGADAKVIPRAVCTVAALLFGGPLAADCRAGPARLLAAVHPDGPNPPVRLVLAPVAGRAREAVRAIGPQRLGAASGHCFAIPVCMTVPAVVAGGSDRTEHAIFPERLTATRGHELADPKHWRIGTMLAGGLKQADCAVGPSGARRARDVPGDEPASVALGLDVGERSVRVFCKFAAGNCRSNSDQRANLVRRRWDD